MSTARLFDLRKDVQQPTIRREWAMPSPHTFSIKPISDALDGWLNGIPPSEIVDPCCGNSTRAGVSNDLRNGVEGCDFLDGLIGQGRKFQAALLDPPYSPRQISESYKSVGREVTGKDTQNAALYRRLKDRLDALLLPGGVAICCGWNSSGFGITRKYRLVEVLMVCHGGAHNDTIVTCEVKTILSSPQVRLAQEAP